MRWRVHRGPRSFGLGSQHGLSSSGPRVSFRLPRMLAGIVVGFHSFLPPCPKHFSSPVAISSKCRKDGALPTPCCSLPIPNQTPFVPTLPFRMGLEALVESYAFWRPSLRTLTFEDIPGIPKQGNSVSWIVHTAKCPRKG